jgi:hypothetical protein
MANTLTAIMPKILARGLMTLRERAVMPRLVNLDYSSEAAMAGTTIDVPIPSAVSATDVTPSYQYSAPSDTTSSTVQISLNKWKKSTPFHLTDKELVELDENRHFVPMQVDEAVRGLANQINSDIFAEYTGVFNCAEIASSGSILSDVSQITESRRWLNSQNSPMDNRRLVMDYAAGAAALQLSGVTAYNETGPSGGEPRISGEIGRRFGLDMYEDGAVPYHTTTAATGGTIAFDLVAGYVAGTTTAHFDGFSATPVVGDCFKVAHGGTVGDKWYVVTGVSGYSTGDVDITFSRADGNGNGGLYATVANDKAVSWTASHTVNLAFHRDAFALATRPLLAQTDEFNGLNSNMISMTDPVTGLSLRLEVTRQYKQVVWEFDILYGVKLVRPELAVRVIDTATI